MLRLYIHQIDVTNVFCNADIAGDVYVGTTDDDEVEPEWCYRLQKSFCVLQSSPRS